jgi:hypothetical protein
MCPPPVVVDFIQACAEGTLGSIANGPSAGCFKIRTRVFSHAVGTERRRGMQDPWSRGWRRARRCQKKSLTTGDIGAAWSTSAGEATLYSKSMEMRTCRSEAPMWPGYTGPSSRPQLHSSRIMCNPALPTSEIVLPEKTCDSRPIWSYSVCAQRPWPWADWNARV